MQDIFITLSIVNQMLRMSLTLATTTMATLRAQKGTLKLPLMGSSSPHDPCMTPYTTSPISQAEKEQEFMFRRNTKSCFTIVLVS
ncbi:hypothetical protein LINPERPRIM_LOCUS25884 [Linum perenne]